MQLRVLGPVEASADHRSLPLGGAKQRSVIAMLGLDANRTVVRRPSDRGPVGRGRAAERREDGAELRVAAPQRAGRRFRCGDPDAGAGLRAADRPRRRGRATLRAAAGGGARRPQRTEHRRRAGGAGAVARAAAGGRGRRALRRVADPSPRGAAVGGDRAGDRRRPGRRPPRRGRGGDRGVDRRAPVAGAAPRPADAGALPHAAARRRRSRRSATRGAVLVEQIGVEPGPELRRLHEAILRQDAGLEIEAATLGAATSAGCRGVDAARGARRRAGSAAHPLATDACTTTAPSSPWWASQGMGKTRVAAELAAIAHGDGAKVLYASGTGAPEQALGVVARASAPGDRVLLVVDDADRARVDVWAAIGRCGDAARDRADARARHGSDRGGAGSARGRSRRSNWARWTARQCARSRPCTRLRAARPANPATTSWTRAAACRDACTTSRVNGRGARPRNAWATWRTARRQAVCAHERWSRS